MAEYILSVHNLKRLFGEGILGEGILFLFLYKVTFTYQLKTIEKNITIYTEDTRHFTSKIK